MDHRRPFGFQWHLTDRCNLRCAHCYQERFDAGRELTLEAAIAAADRVMGSLTGREVSINLTGGEPLLLPWLFDLVRHLESFEALAEVHVITNGTRASERALEGLRSIRAPGAIKVSLESATAATNDAIRGRGDLARVSENLPLLVSTGRPVVLMATVSKRNAGDLRGLLELARERGLAGLLLERFVPLGRGRGLSEDVLDGPSWWRVVREVTELAGVDGEDPDEPLDGFEAFWLVLEGGDVTELRGATCNLGDESMALMPDGTVYPCRRLPVAVGCVFDEPFERILGKLARWSPSVARGRLTGPRCSGCAVAGCAGCRALARAVTGDLWSDDPLCRRAVGEGERRGAG